MTALGGFTTGFGAGGILAIPTSVRPGSPDAGSPLFIASVPDGRFSGEVDGGGGAGAVDPDTLRDPTPDFAAGTAPLGLAPALAEVGSILFSPAPTAPGWTLLSAVFSTATVVGSTFLLLGELAASARAPADLDDAVFCPILSAGSFGFFGSSDFARTVTLAEVDFARGSDLTPVAEGALG